MKIVLILALALIALKSTVLADCHCDENFSGFGTEPGKCGCCPWPCCCKCLNVTKPCPVSCPCIQLGFLLDESGSIGSSDWVELMVYVNAIIDGVVAFTDPDECGDQVFVTVITYGSNATVHYTHEPFQNTDVNSIVQGKKQTNLVEGMERAIEIFDQPTDCVKLVVIITDGKANFRVNEIPAVSADLRDATDDNLYCIGITSNIDKVQLNETCPDEDHRITRLYFDDLVDTAGILLEEWDDMFEEICDVEECFCCCSPEQFWGGYGGRYN